MKITPLNDRVVIKRFEADEKSAGGILLPDAARNKPQKGEVLAVGPGDDILLMHEEDILAVLE